MKKLDRAMYAIFLLALLADVARSRVPAPAGQDSIGGLILSAAHQLGVGPAGSAALVVRRANSTLPSIAGFRGYRSALAGWAKILSRQSVGPNSGILTALASGAVASLACIFIQPNRLAPPSLGIFEHSGSPAP